MWSHHEDADDDVDDDDDDVVVVVVSGADDNVVKGGTGATDATTVGIAAAVAVASIPLVLVAVVVSAAIFAGATPTVSSLSVSFSVVGASVPPRGRVERRCFGSSGSGWWCDGRMNDRAFVIWDAIMDRTTMRMIPQPFLILFLRLPLLIRTPFDRRPTWYHNITIFEYDVLYLGLNSLVGVASYSKSTQLPENAIIDSNLCVLIRRFL